MMSEFKGTKGPWFFNGREIESVECAYIADVNGTDASQDEECCNARLIAAAPDLLEALDKITKEYIFTRGQLNGDFEDDLVDVLCIKNARAAIAKALGETK